MPEECCEAAWTCLKSLCTVQVGRRGAADSQVVEDHVDEVLLERLKKITRLVQLMVVQQPSSQFSCCGSATSRTSDTNFGIVPPHDTDMCERRPQLHGRGP